MAARIEIRGPDVADGRLTNPELLVGGRDADRFDAAHATIVAAVDFFAPEERAPTPGPALRLLNGTSSGNGAFVGVLLFGPILNVRA